MGFGMYKSAMTIVFAIKYHPTLALSAREGRRRKGRAVMKSLRESVVHTEVRQHSAKYRERCRGLLVELPEGRSRQPLKVVGQLKCVGRHFYSELYVFLEELETEVENEGCSSRRGVEFEEIRRSLSRSWEDRKVWWHGKQTRRAGLDGGKACFFRKRIGKSRSRRKRDEIERRNLAPCVSIEVESMCEDRKLSSSLELVHCTYCIQGASCAS